MRYLIVYDISEDSIRGKVNRLLVKYGMRVQYSAFEIEVSSKEELKKLTDEINSLINPDTDAVFFFELTKNAYKFTIKLGEKEGLSYVL